jgi:hypothetical protein
MQTENVSIGKKRQISGRVLMILGGLILIESSSAKFAHIPAVVNRLSAMGFDGTRLTFIAGLEVVSALLLLFAFTRSLGLLLVSSYLGGAIATNLQHGQPIVLPAFVLFLIWLGMWLRHPQMLWSFGHNAHTRGCAG